MARGKKKQTEEGRIESLSAYLREAAANLDRTELQCRIDAAKEVIREAEAFLYGQSALDVLADAETKVLSQVKPPQKRGRRAKVAEARQLEPDVPEELPAGFKRSPAAEPLDAEVAV